MTTQLVRRWVRRQVVLDEEEASSYEHLRGEFIGETKMKTTRRDFLKVGATMAGVASGISAAGEAVSSSAESAGKAVPPNASKGAMPYRRLGRPGAQVSAIGVGGPHPGDLPSLDDALRLCP